MLSRSSRSREFLRKLVNGVKASSTSMKDTYLNAFFHADVELINISNELDSFDGKKDQIRCNLLVNQLRTGQDRVISIIFQLMDECRCQRAPRDYRMKFPDEILLSEGSESLNGQIWFGAECLSAGSNILNHTKESFMLRPMAKKLTANLDQLRRKLRGLVAGGGNASWIGEDLMILMSDFDKIFTTFEYEYVRTMLPIRTVAEIERLQEVAVLFSETLIDCVKRGLLKHQDIEGFEPIVMIAIPRLAIVRGLLYTNENRIFSKHKSQMCSLFEPFHGALLSIRRLLRNLKSHELLTLEKMLANDQSVSTETKKSQSLCQGLQNSDKNFDQDTDYSKVLVENLQYPVGQNIETVRTNYALVPASPLASSSLQANDIPTSSTHCNNSNDSNSPLSSSLSGYANQGIMPPVSKQLDTSITQDHQNNEDQQFQKLVAEFSPQTSTYSNGNQKIIGDKEMDNTLTNDIGEQLYYDMCTRSFKLRSEKTIENEQSDKIHEFFTNQSQQLLQRMFVAISGVADQLQSNFASDLRFILKNIFVAELELDDESQSSSPIEEGIEAQEIADLIDLNLNVDDSNVCGVSSQQNYCANHQNINELSVEDVERMVIDDNVTIIPPDNIPNSRQTTSRRRSCNCIDNEIGENQTPQQTSNICYSSRIQSNYQQSGRRHRSRQSIPQESGYDSENRSNNPHNRTRSSRGSRHERGSGNLLAQDRSRNHHSNIANGNMVQAIHQSQGPVWVPDQLVVACLRCDVNFSLFTRRHHCRACGQIFCAECSKYRRVLNYLGCNGPVRVCESCYNISGE